MEATQVHKSSHFIPTPQGALASPRVHLLTGFRGGYHFRAVFRIAIFLYACGFNFYIFLITALIQSVFYLTLWRCQFNFGI